MTDRYAEDIREIAGSKDTNSASLKALEDRKAIGGKRGVGWINTIGQGVGKSGNQDTLRDPENGGADDGENSANNLTDPSSAFYGRDMADFAGGIGSDIGELIDFGEDTPNQNDGLDYDGKPLVGGDFVDNLTGKDCTTNKEINLRFDDNFLPPDAGTNSDGLPTNEWEDAETPPELEDFDSAYVWTSVADANAPSYPPVSMQSPQQFLDYAEGKAIEAETTLGFPPGTVTFIEITVITASINLVKYRNDANPARTNSLQIGRGTCASTSNPDEQAQCALAAPTEEYWPTESPTQYTKGDDGLFKTSQYDSTAPTGSIDGVGTIDFCDSAGGTVRAEVGANNTTLLYRTDGAGQGMTSGTIATILDSSGNVTGYTDSVGIDSYRLR